MRATGIVRRIDELGRVVIPKEIRRTLRIREGDPLLMTGGARERGLVAMMALGERRGW
ncbi:MAG: AbrB/MazE/SpoVT family DNA-binding domain-containing protein [Clostridiales bacterium]|nr:AbrB/MazE/SpoVT family DNA-binding domain-containing protein [Clostridiales bacterium]